MERAFEPPVNAHRPPVQLLRMKCLACNGGGLVSGVPSTKKRSSCRRCHGTGIETDWNVHLGR